MKPLTFLKKNISLLKYSFDKKQFLHSLGIDVLLILLFVAFVFAFLFPLQNAIDEAAEILPTAVRGDMVEQNALLTLEDIYNRILILGIAFFISTCVAYTATRLFIWRRISKSKAPSELMRKRFGRYVVHFFVILAGIILFMGIPFGFILVLARNVEVLAPQQVRSLSILMTILLLTLFHLQLIFNRLFALSSKAWISVKQSVNIGFLRINYFIIPYIIGILLFLVAVIPGRLLGFILPGRIHLVVYVLLLLAYVSVMRLYLNKLIAIIQKKFYSK
jgi:hypothetical protein